MLVRFVFSHDESGQRGNDGFNDGKFIVFVYGRLAVYPSFAKEMDFSFPISKMRMAVVDGEMVVFV